MPAPVCVVGYVFVRMPAPVRASSGSLVVDTEDGVTLLRLVRARGRRHARGRHASLSLSLLDADSSTRRVGVGDQLKIVLSRSTRTPAHGECRVGVGDQLKLGRLFSLSLLLDADSSTQGGESAVGDQLKTVVLSAGRRISKNSTRTPAHSTASRRISKKVLRRGLQHTASRRRRSAKNRSLSIRCGLQHTGTASRRSVVLSLFCSTRTPAHGESGSAIN